MRHEQKLLILTAGYGDGHTKVAQALKQKFEQYHFRVLLVDLYQEAHPIMNSIAKFLYKNSTWFSTCGLDYYGWYYYWTRNKESDHLFLKWIHALGVKTLAKLIQKEKPAAIVSTFPYGGGGMNGYLRNLGLSVPTYTVITDFMLHKRWLHWVPDQYFVVAEDLKQAMIRDGIPKERITVSGIPIRRQFEHIHNGSTNADNGRRAVLILSGSYMKLRDTFQLMNELLRMPDIRINIVCGRNKKLKHALDSRYGSRSNISLYGFVEQIHEIMSRSSCIITKAGSITLSEAIHVNIPILIYNPLPGQEKENADYLAAKEIALVSTDIDQLCMQTRDVLFNHEKKEMMRRRARTMQKIQAADVIVSHIISTLDRKLEISAEENIEGNRWWYHNFHKMGL